MVYRSADARLLLTLLLALPLSAWLVAAHLAMPQVSDGYIWFAFPYLIIAFFVWCYLVQRLHEAWIAHYVSRFEVARVPTNVGLPLPVTVAIQGGPEGAVVRHGTARIVVELVRDYEIYDYDSGYEQAEESVRVLSTPPTRFEARIPPHQFRQISLTLPLPPVTPDIPRAWRKSRDTKDIFLRYRLEVALDVHRVGRLTHTSYPLPHVTAA